MRFIFLGIFLFTGSLLNAQVISHKVIANGGSFSSNGGYYLESTIGEVAVFSYQNSGKFITQGFQQPSMIYKTNSSKPGSGTAVSVYPNPVEDDLILEINVEEVNNFTVEVYTFTGVSLYIRQLPQLTKGINYFTINFSGFSRGIYLVHIYSPEKEISRLFKIEKL
ncbi:MAG: T9SS type A sorting domain-containing protein [Bacteroidetes bacterium]|nr:T9SS type A sorting domain-containing protein [Bacteroidota bacterium]